MFNARWSESYRLMRDVLGESPDDLSMRPDSPGPSEPPQSLSEQIFPWVEHEQATLDARSAGNTNARDYALKNFLSLLIWFRRILLQDAAVLSTQHPKAPFLQYAPFNTVEFHQFAAVSTAVISRAEDSARLALEHLPDKYAQTFRGLVQGITLEQQKAQAHDVAQSAMLTVLMQSVQAIKTGFAAEPRTKRQRSKTAGAGVLRPPDHHGHEN
jgi:hypothetical protein